MDGCSVKLTADEGLACGTAAILQMMRATQRNWVGNDHGGESGRSVRDRWAQSIHGMMAEFAVCKHLGVCWTAGVSGVAGSDAYGIEIRATPWATGCLIINESDVEKHADHPFVLATGHWPEFTLRGWMTAKDSARSEWHRPDERPASYWVPQNALRDMANIPAPQSRRGMGCE